MQTKQPISFINNLILNNLIRQFSSSKVINIKNITEITDYIEINDLNDINNNNNDTSISILTDEKSKTVTKKDNFNSWILAERFTHENPNVHYCTDINEFYIYENLLWKPLKTIDLKRTIILWVKSTFKNYLSFQPRRADEIIELLQSLNTFSMIESKKLANNKGFLIPFLNGVLNSKTSQFFPHNKTNYITHILPIDYNSNTNLDNFPNTNMFNFLNHLCDNNPTKLEVLRACLNAMLTNDVSYQLSLYLYGPGGTGKSTLVNILMFILGAEGSFSTNLSKLGNRFSTYSLMNKILLVLNDIPLYKGKEPDLLKIIITSDPIEIEQKYKSPFQFKPNLFVLITSNSIWDIKGATTGLTRRMIYFNITNVPPVKNTSHKYKLSFDNFIKFRT